MDIDKLKALLNNGSITQEEYESMVRMYGLQDEQKEGEEDKKPEQETNKEIDIEKLVQQRVDKAIAKLGKDKSDLQKQLDQLKKEKMTDEERKQFELSEKEKLIADREKALLEKENRLYAIKAIKEAGLDDGSDKSLELVDFVMDTDTEAIDNKIKAFDALVKKFVKAEVDKTFKTNGRTPDKSTTSGNTVNPYAKETFNFTQQMKLEAENPALANQLKSAAGIN